MQVSNLNKKNPFIGQTMSDEKITVDKAEYDELKKIAKAVLETLETKKMWQNQGFTGYDEEIALCEKYLEKSDIQID